MDEEVLRDFADQLGAEPDQILDRWEGRPDLIIDDIFRVRDIDTGEVRDLELFDVQRKLVHAYFYGDAGILNAYKGRRIGYSFVVVACFLLEALFYPNSFYPLVSRSLSQAKDRIDDIQNLIDHAKVDIPTEKENTDYIELWNESAFMAYSADSDTSRGADSARAVLMDEMAFIEDEEKAQRAFGAFLALGENRKMVEISTPNTKNDVFMQHNREGSPDGRNGIISLKQPTFDNADDIDIHTPLHEQELHPVRPEINIEQLETERMADPEGFGQEYLCRPVVDEYRFFDEDTIRAAQERGADPAYPRGLDAVKPNGARRIMGVDIGINRDDTVLSIMDHEGDQRKQRALIVADDEWLHRAGVANPDRGNANHIAQLIDYVAEEMRVDLVIMDKGGVGQTFDRIIEKKLGRAYTGFDFSAKDDVAEMMGDTNICLRNGDMTLVPDDRLFDELSAVVKEKRDQYQRPKFSGKDNSESGKDDTAMATALSAFPPSESAKASTRPAAKERPEPARPRQRQQKPDGDRRPTMSATSVNRSSRSRTNRYSSNKRRNRR
jgi:hypothetical protein